MACVGTGLWTGFFFAIAGGLGLAASQRPSYSMVTAFMVMSIISALFAIPLIVISGKSIFLGKNASQVELFSFALFKDLELVGMIAGTIEVLDS